MVRPREIFPYVTIVAFALTLFLLRVSASLAWPESSLAALAAAAPVAEAALDLQTEKGQISGAVQAVTTSAPEALAPSSAAKASGDCQVSDRFPKDVRQWCELITAQATRNGLEPDLVAALIWQESGGNPAAYSHSGAVGLMQIMARDGLAAKFICANGPCFQDRPTMAKLKDPEFNVTYGTRMLANLVKKYGSLRDALKAYGPMDVGYSYADKVLSLFKRYGK